MPYKLSNARGPQTEAAEAIHAMKYRLPGESFQQSMERISRALQDDYEHGHEFFDILLTQRFLPAGRVQASAGAPRAVTGFNCFVSGTIPDSMVTPDNEHKSSIMHRALEAAQTMRMGGGIGYDFSTLRPKNAPIESLGSTSSGPISFMRIFDQVCHSISSAGHRRGAQMGVLRCDHPDIEEFVVAKQDNTTLTGFNISVAVTDKLMDAVARGASFDLVFNSRVYKTVDARELWDKIMRSTWDWAEPGVLFIDTINRMNNLWYCETIAATNPCAEQSLPPFGACLLGSFNLVQYLSRDVNGYYLDYGQLRADIPEVVRAMDNVTSTSLYPLEQQRAEAFSKRRMGLGVTGLANALETLGHPYGSLTFIDEMNSILRLIRDETYAASMRLAIEKGAFPLWDAEKYGAGQFVRTLDYELQQDIRRFGIRNSHLTSIAPTGTISMTADNVSSGLEPVFSLGAMSRPIHTPAGPKVMVLQDYGERKFGTKARVTERVSPREHVDVLVNASQFVDSAISKTCNLDGTVAWDEFKSLYTRAWAGGAKGCTTFNKDGKRMALLTAVKPADTSGSTEEASCRIDMETGRRECS